MSMNARKIHASTVEFAKIMLGILLVHVILDGKEITAAMVMFKNFD